MATAGSAVHTQAAGRDHGFHPLRVARVVTETADTRSFVLAVPAELAAAFAYRAGQFCTFRVRVEGQLHLRCYSMSSSPDVDDELQVTVKRVPGGAVSNWMIDSLGPGDVLETTCPAGVFCLGREGGDVIGFAAGSGITPVFSLVKTVLATTTRRVRLLYANRDRDSIIFGAELDALATRYAGRLDVVHHLDADRGFVDTEAVHPHAIGPSDAEYFICGPEPFMDIVEATLRDQHVDARRIHIERFTPPERSTPADASSVPTTGPRVTIEFGGRVDTADHHPGTTILQTARQMGMTPPFSCESGSCATCMARLVDGTVTMLANNALTDDEVADGWVLTCQSVPSSPSVHVIYEEG